MKIRVQNLGVLKDGEVNLDRPLTVFTGPNNSGKTYMSQVLYAAARAGLIFRRSKKKSEYKYFKDIVDNLWEKGSADFDLKYFTLQNSSQLLEDFSACLTDDIQIILGKNAPDFPDAHIKIVDDSFFSLIFSNPTNQIRVGNFAPLLEVNNWFLMDYYDKEDQNKIRFKESRRIEKIKKSEDTNEVNQAKQEIYDTIENIVMASLLFQYTPYFFSAERLGVLVFGPELRAYYSFQDLTNPQDSLRNHLYEAHPYAIQSEIQMWVMSQVHSDLRRESLYTQIAEELGNALLNGRIIGDTKHEKYYFYPNATPDVKINLSASGSSVKALSSLITTLEKIVFKNDIIFIDEPEMNLHPRNQRILARYLAKLANAGLRLVVSTHSDYILRELNNMIILGTLPESEQKQTLISEWNIEPEMCLASENVRAYIFNEGRIDEVEITNEGVSAEQIDEAIQIGQQETEDVYHLLYNEDE